MRNALPNKAHKYESAIVNLDDENGSGTHWVAYRKQNNVINYYDSFGNLNPTKELLKYFGNKAKIIYNYNTEQDYNSYKCGHLCLNFLINST